MGSAQPAERAVPQEQARRAWGTPAARRGAGCVATTSGAALRASSGRGRRGAHAIPAPCPCTPSLTLANRNMGWKGAGVEVCGALAPSAWMSDRVPFLRAPQGLGAPAPLAACLLQRRGDQPPDLRRIPGYRGKTASSFAFPDSFFFLILLPGIQPE